MMEIYTILFDQLFIALLFLSVALLFLLTGFFMGRSAAGAKNLTKAPAKAKDCQPVHDDSLSIYDEALIGGDMDKRIETI